MATQSVTVTPGAWANRSIASNPDWTNPSNAGASDNAYATVTTTGGQSDGLDGDTMGLALPAGSVVVGIEVLIEGKQNVSDANQQSGSFRNAAGTQISDSKSGTLGTVEGTLTLGSSTDTWGMSNANLTAAVFNDSSFSYWHISSATGVEPTITHSIDHIQITVYYRPPMLLNSGFIY